MQYILDMEGWGDRLHLIDRRLREYFHGFPPRYLILDPVSQLVMSLLGGQTYSHLSRAAHARLRAHYGPHWSAVRDAGLEAVEACIRGVTRAEQKAHYIVDILDQLSDGKGEPSLDHLKGMSVADAHRCLEELKGVGPKIAAAVINTSTIRQRSLVIDTHHLRILQRLGLVRTGANFPQAYHATMPLIPAEWGAMRIDHHHMLFKRLGQTICCPSHPHCKSCPLLDICAYRISRQSGRDPVIEAA